LAFNRTIALRHRISLEQQQTLPSMIDHDSQQFAAPPNKMYA
jgi:hypothetical protein